MQTSDRLIFQGSPLGGGGLVIGMVVGLSFIAAAGAGYSEASDESVLFRMLFALMGAAIVIAFTVLMTFRERLELDKLTGSGLHERWSIVGGKRKRLEFRLEHIQGVHLVHSVRATARSRKSGSRRIDVWEAKLQITLPPKSLLLAKEYGAKSSLTHVVAQPIADFLGVTLKTEDEARE